MNVVERSMKGIKTLWVKEELIVTSSFSLSHSVFKRHVEQTCKKLDLFGKDLNDPEEEGENGAGKRKHAGKENFDFLTAFPTLSKTEIII